MPKARKFPEVNSTLLWILGDERLYSKPENLDGWAPIEGLPTAWNLYKDQILRDWIREFPGTRPSAWWDFESPEPRQRLGGIGDPAWQHLGYSESYALGIPNIWVSPFDVEYYNGRARDIHGSRIETEYKEGNFKGVAIDPKNPPVYESQAAYLRRLGLLTPEEKRRLKPKDFEPEVVMIDEPEDQPTKTPESSGTIQ